MKEFIEKLIGRLEEKIEVWRRDVTSGVKQDDGYLSLDTASKSGRIRGLLDAIEIVNQLAEEHNGGWIPCNKELPPQPEKNPVFENKPLELYLVTVKNTEYSFRAFWNGKFFTDGWSKLDVIAWQPLPASYKEGEK